jgi:hypothetical protein
MGLTPRPERVQFKDKHKRGIVWVLASGASLNYIPVEMFRDQTVVAVNYIGLELGLPNYYMASHYHLDAIAVSEVQPHTTIVVPEIDQGGTQLAPHAPTGDNVWGFPTNQQRYAQFNVATDWPREPDSLVVGPTSLHFAMDFARYLVGVGGTIVLVGADAGTIDGEENRSGHDRGIGSPWGVWAQQLPEVAGHIRYLGTNVVSLSPWVSFLLEGHSFWSPLGSVNP